MKRIFKLSISMLAMAGCFDVKPVDTCAQSTQFIYHEASTGSWPMLDLLIVVDNSQSMKEEQVLLADSIFELIETVMSPSWEYNYSGAEDIHVAVVTSDMGLSWGGQPYEYGDGWPGEPPCSAAGDDGAFIGNENNSWSELYFNDENADEFFSEVAVSLDGVSSEGCELTQPLAAAIRGLDRPDQAAFVRDGSVLAVVVVSDSDDCSLADGVGMFATSDIQMDGYPEGMESACARRTQFLQDIDQFITDLTAQNSYSDQKDVFFGAVTGIPMVPDCEGPGSTIGACLENEKMQVPSNQKGPLPVVPACERSVDEQIVTSATPARRLVETAVKMGEASYIASICNGDWAASMREMGNQISQMMIKNCWHQGKLDWDPLTSTSTCSLFFEFINAESCPPIFKEAGTAVKGPEASEGDVERTYLYCPVPAIPTSLYCSQIDYSDEVSNEFGWVYCENPGDEECPYRVVLSPSAEEAVKHCSFIMVCPVNGSDPDCWDPR